MPGEFSHHVRIYGIAERLESSCLPLRQVTKLPHALKAAAFADGHVALLPRNHRDLARGHRNKRGRGRRALHADAGCPELQNVLPDVPVLALAVPFELLKASSEIPDRGQPVVDPFPLALIEFAVLANEIYLPFWKRFGASACVRRQRSYDFLPGQTTKR